MLIEPAQYRLNAYYLENQIAIQIHSAGYFLKRCNCSHRSASEKLWIESGGRTDIGRYTIFHVHAHSSSPQVFKNWCKFRMNFPLKRKILIVNTITHSI